MKRLLPAAIAVLALLAPAAAAAPAPAGTRAVLFVGNNWDGTADIVDPETFMKLGRFNAVPDLQERLGEIAANPASWASTCAATRSSGASR